MTTRGYQMSSVQSGIDKMGLRKTATNTRMYSQRKLRIIETSKAAVTLKIDFHECLVRRVSLTHVYTHSYTLTHSYTHTPVHSYTHTLIYVCYPIANKPLSLEI